LSLARREVVDGVHKHYEELTIPKPTRGFLYATCFDMMVLDLTVCWEHTGSGSLPRIASRLIKLGDDDLRKYIGPYGELPKARKAGPFIEKMRAKIEPHLDTLFTLRNKRIAHYDSAHALEMPEVPKASVDAVQVATDATLDHLDKVIGSLGPAGADIIRIAGENLVKGLAGLIPEQLR
jgi:hypothetical protein